MRQDGQKREGAPPSPRGSTPPPRGPRFRPGSWWIALFVGLLVLNFILGTRATQPAARVRVPYTPFFLDQVRAGHVKEITSKGTAIQGTFTEPEQYANSKPTRKFNSLRICRSSRADCSPASTSTER